MYKLIFSFINGLMAAIVSIVLFLIVNAVSPKLNFGLLTNAVISLFFMIRAGRQERMNYGGSLSFGEAIIPAFITFTVATILHNVFYFLMLKFSPVLIDLALESAMEAEKNAAEMLGANPDDIAIEMEEVPSMTKETLTNISTLFTSIIGNMFFPGIIYVIIAALVAKKKGGEQLSV